MHDRGGRALLLGGLERRAVLRVGKHVALSSTGTCSSFDAIPASMLNRAGGEPLRTLNERSVTSRLTLSRPTLYVRCAWCL